MRLALSYLFICCVLQADPPNGGGGDHAGLPLASESLTTPESVYFPADNSPADYIISSDEFDAFKAAWQQGQRWEDTNAQIPIDDASLCGTIFFGFEGIYHVIYTDGVPAFIPGAPEPSDGSTGSVVDTIVVIPIGPVPATVSIDVDPPEGAVAYAIEEQIPDGWIFNDSSSGHYNESDGILRIGPSPARSKTFEYTLWSILGGSRTPTKFDSTISYDGISEALSAHSADAQYGLRLASWVVGGEEETFSAQELWGFAIQGDDQADYQSLLPQLEPGIDENGKPCITGRIYRFKLADDVEMRLQYSNNLSDWHSVTDFELSHIGEYAPDINEFEVSIPCPEDSSSPYFFRAKVIHHDIDY